MLLDSSDEEDELASPKPMIDIDTNSDAILDVSEYAPEIHDYLKKAEVSRPQTKFLNSRVEIIFTSFSVRYSLQWLDGMLIAVVNFITQCYVTRVEIIYAHKNH